jgi:hypothetical protein
MRDYLDAEMEGAMFQIKISATEPNCDEFLYRGTYDISRVPCKGELIEMGTSSGGVLVAIEHVVHCVDRATHVAEVYCRHVATGNFAGVGAAELVGQALGMRTGRQRA